MPTNTSEARVVVGIDATPASKNGVRFAALEAQRLGAELHIVHATPTYSDVPGDIQLLDESTLATHGQTLLEEAEGVARAAVPDLSMRTHLMSGGAVDTLVANAEGALMLVLGAERRSLAGRIWTGDIVGGVVARASCPVVVVASEWEPTEASGRVVVGLESMETAPQLLAEGLSLAHNSKAELVVVHAWKLQSGYDDLVANRGDADAYGRSATSKIEPVVNDLRQQISEVPVRIEVLHAQPAFALVDASTDADRLLLARQRHARLPHHLGPVTRAVLREAQCPVEIVPARSADRADAVTT